MDKTENQYKPRVELIAKIAHNMNKAYCESIGDNSQVSWFEADEHIKNLTISGVESIMSNYHITPEELHGNWVKYKKKAGYNFGKVKDVVKKTHPDILPFNELQQEQKNKYYLFIAVVRQLILIV